MCVRVAETNVGWESYVNCLARTMGIQQYFGCVCDEALLRRHAGGRRWQSTELAIHETNHDQDQDGDPQWAVNGNEEMMVAKRCNHRDADAQAMHNKLAHGAARLLPIGKTEILMGAKSLNDVDASGADGRKRRGNNGGGQQNEGGKDHGQGAGHLDVEEIAAGQTRHYIAECGAGEDARSSHDSAFRDDTFQEVAGL